jgi:hypothetical protein
MSLKLDTLCFLHAAGSHSYDLLYAVAKSVVLSPRYRCLFPLPYYREEEEIAYEMGTISAELANHPSFQVLPSDLSIPLRYATAITCGLLCTSNKRKYSLRILIVDTVDFLCNV